MKKKYETWGSDWRGTFATSPNGREVLLRETNDYWTNHSGGSMPHKVLDVVRVKHGGVGKTRVYRQICSICDCYI